MGEVQAVGDVDREVDAAGPEARATGGPEETEGDNQGGAAVAFSFAVGEWLSSFICGLI
jgi:hypothetical protein